jgi:hypothetical protein
MMASSESNILLGSIQRILGGENRTTAEIYLHSINYSEIADMGVYARARGRSPSDSPSVKGEGLILSRAHKSNIVILREPKATEESRFFTPVRSVQNDNKILLL